MDAFDWEGLTQITDSCRDNIRILVTDKIKNIIDVYEKEHIVKELLKLAKEDEEVSFDILEKNVLPLLSTKNRSNLLSLLSILCILSTYFRNGFSASNLGLWCPESSV